MQRWSQRSFAACAREVMRPDLIMRSIIPVVTSSARRLAFQPSSAVLFIIRLYTLKFVLISFRSFFCRSLLLAALHLFSYLFLQ